LKCNQVSDVPCWVVRIPLWRMQNCWVLLWVVLTTCHDRLTTCVGGGYRKLQIYRQMLYQAEQDVEGPQELKSSSSLFVFCEIVPPDVE
jgi:hypothetical protein